jgi:hypothetical protein
LTSNFLFLCGKTEETEEETVEETVEETEETRRKFF